MRILFTGGETGGHIFPLIAVADKIKEITGRQGIEVKLFYVGAPGIYEAELIRAGAEVSKIASAKLRRYFDLRNFIDIPKFFFSIVQAFWKVFWIMPDVLFSKGGTGSFPAVLAGWFYRVPVVIHESDSYPGYQNLLSARFASRIGISFESAAEAFTNIYKKEVKKNEIAQKIAIVGSPIRDFYLSESDVNQETAKKISGFNPEKKLIAVISGSQGSTRINDFFLDAAEDILSAGFQVLHQAGLNNLESFNQELSFVLEKLPYEYKSLYKTAAFLNGKFLKDALVAADVIVSRSGSFIFEIAAMGKPSILVPLEESAGDHQRKNAYEYAKTGAAVVIEEGNLTSHVFMAQLNKIFSDREFYNAMSAAAKKFAKPEAAKLLAEEIMKIAKT